MINSNFDFITDKVLRTHLDRAFDLILELLTLSEARNYSPELKSSFRKTIIIYTASIIEVLLLYILKKNKTESDCAETRDSIGETLYEIDDLKRIALVEKKTFAIKFEKLNLDQINKLCTTHNLVSKTLSKEINGVREYRNRQHLGSLSDVEMDYSRRDLESVFSVAKKVKELAQN